MGFGAAAAGTAALTAADVAGAGAIAAGAGDIAALTAPAVASIGTGASFASTLATVGTVASLASGAIGAIGASNTAKATSQSAAYQAQVAANNQAIAQNQANQATAAGESAVEQQGLKTRAEVGAIMAGQAASNIDVTSGSAVDVRSSAAALGELDALTIRSNAARQSYGYQTNATSFGAQAGLEQNIARQAPIAGEISATGSLLSGATGAANQYLNWQRVAGSGVGPTTATFF